MARGPHGFEDRQRFESIKQKVRLLRDEREARADGSVHPDRERLKSAATTLIYEDMEWLITKIERNWP